MIVTDVQLHAGEEFVRVSTRFDNPSRDHRLRAWFPLPDPADHTVAECAFATVSRGAAPRAVRTSRPLGTYPARRFVTAGGLTLTHEGLLEHELVDDGAGPGPDPAAVHRRAVPAGALRPAQPGRSARRARSAPSWSARNEPATPSRSVP